MRQFRAPDDPMPVKPAKFPHKPPANRPPYNRSVPSAAIRAAVAAAEARRQCEDGEP